ncbi:FecR family protein [Sphingomonas sp. DT-207]|uniref:FecR family protein n=1 Tax=Sphingomonas sp. DT-207 TaxID=3396167 RepID=UPI003F19F9D6
MAVDSMNEIEDQAARWSARVAHGEMTAARSEELEAWLMRDRRHRGAYLRAQAALIHLEETVIEGPRLGAIGNDNPPVPVGRIDTPRRARWPRYAIGGGVIAACVAGLLMFGLPALRPTASGAASPTEIALADGSVVVLGAGGRISQAIGASRREVTLQSGEATFRVAHDASRPFVVRSGRVFAQATGTVYSVRRLRDDGGVVRVREGSVLVWAEGARAAAVAVRAGGSMSLDPQGRDTAPANAAQQSLPGPDHLAEFSFDDVPIATAAARFNRVNSTKIVIRDKALGATPIVGLFKSDEPERFAEAAAALTGARVVRREGAIVIEK